MSIKKISIVVLVILLGLYFFYLYFPIMLVGAPGPLYYIRYNDTIPHNLTVEIFDENNISVFMNNYTIKSDTNIRFNRELQWFLPFPSTFVTWYDGMYTFNFTVDNNISNEITIDINQYMTVAVEIKPSINNEEKVDIEIKIWTV